MTYVSRIEPSINRIERLLYDVTSLLDSDKYSMEKVQAEVESALLDIKTVCKQVSLDLDKAVQKETMLIQRINMLNDEVSDLDEVVDDVFFPHKRVK